jgi:hypothetical protein
MNTKSKIKMISRRSFLKRLGGVGFSGAMLKMSLLSGNMLWARSVFAADAPKRVIFVYTPGGAIPDQWMPSGSGTGFSLPAMSAPLDSVKEHCVFLKGVSMSNAGHGLTSKALSGDATTSLDIYMARTMGQSAPYSHVQLGVVSNGFGSMSRNNWNEPSFEDSPITAFGRLFGAGSSSAVRADTGVNKMRNVLDCNLEVLTQMRNELGSFEKARLDEHADAIERIGARLDSGSTQPGSGSAECESPTFNSSNFNGDTNNAVNYDIVADLQIDVATLAMKCDLTRVVSLMLGNHQCDYTVPEAGVSTNYHQSIHGRPAEDYIKYRAYFTTKLQYLIQSLASAQDMDGGSLLDNTILLHVSDMGDARGHTGDDVPYMLAGRGGGVLTTGRSLNVSTDHKSILDTVASAFGVDANADYPRYGSGPVSGILG